VSVRFDSLDKLDHVLDVFCRLADDIRPDYVQPVNVIEKSVRVEFGDFKNRLMAFLSCLEHFVLALVCVSGKMPDVCYVHNVLFVVSEESERAVKRVKKNVGAEISDVRVVVDGRSAAVKSHKTFVNRNEFFHLAAHCVVQSQRHFFSSIENLVRIILSACFHYRFFYFFSIK